MSLCAALATLLREQVELTSRLSAELVEERQRRGVAEGTMADLQRQLTELERGRGTTKAGAGLARMSGPVGPASAASLTGAVRTAREALRETTGPAIRGLLARLVSRKGVR